MAIRQTVRVNYPRANRLVTAPTTEAIEPSDLRVHLGVEEAALSDSAASQLIKEARDMIETHLNCALLTQSWQLTMDGWPRGQGPWWDGVRQGHVSMLDAPAHLVDVEIPRWPLQSITSVTVYDAAGNSTAVTVADTFDVDTQSIPARITLKVGATWPVALRANNAIEIVYEAGYGDLATDVPFAFVRAVKNLAAALFANRGDCDTGKILEQSGAGGIIDMMKIVRV